MPASRSSELEEPGSNRPHGPTGDRTTSSQNKLPPSHFHNTGSRKLRRERREVLVSSARLSTEDGQAKVRAKSRYSARGVSRGGLRRRTERLGSAILSTRPPASPPAAEAAGVRRPIPTEARPPKLHRPAFLSYTSTRSGRVFTGSPRGQSDAQERQHRPTGTKRSAAKYLGTAWRPRTRRARHRVSPREETDQ